MYTGAINKKHKTENDDIFKEIPELQTFFAITNSLPLRKHYDFGIHLKPDSKFTSGPQRLLSTYENKIICDYVAYMTAKGLIRPSNSSITSPTFLVKKKRQDKGLYQLPTIKFFNGAGYISSPPYREINKRTPPRMYIFENRP
jgi:hypothetical protein